MPHHAVFRKDASTTKTRVVLNASAAKVGQKSLNDTLDQGPSILPSLVGLLLRFRLKKIALQADIKKAFFTIAVEESDRRYLRFVRPDEKGSMTTYLFTRLPFGVNCSPFIMTAVLCQHLNLVAARAEDYDKVMLKLLRDSFYVDDCVASVDSDQEAVHFKELGVSALQEASMELRKWRSNGKINDDSQPQDGKVLGVTWHSRQDTLTFQNNVTAKQHLTKNSFARCCLLVWSIGDHFALRSSRKDGHSGIMEERCHVGWNSWNFASKATWALVGRRNSAWRASLSQMDKVYGRTYCCSFVYRCIGKSVWLCDLCHGRFEVVFTFCEGEGRVGQVAAAGSTRTSSSIYRNSSTESCFAWIAYFFHRSTCVDGLDDRQTLDQPSALSIEDICSKSCQWNSRTQRTLVCHLASLPGFAKPCGYNNSRSNCCWASWYVLAKWSEVANTKRELAFGALVSHRGVEERTNGPTGNRYAWKREMVDSLFEMDNGSRSGTYNVVLEVPKLDEIWD